MTLTYLTIRSAFRPKMAYSSAMDTGGDHVRVETVAAEARTLGDVIRLRAARTPERAAQFTKSDGRWLRTSWRELYDQARRVARGLTDLGLKVGESVSVIGPTGPEWARQELGALLCGAVTNGIYPNQAVEQIHYLLEHSETRVVFVGEEHELANVLEAVRDNTHLKAIVPWTDELARQFEGADPRVVSPERFEGEALGEDEIDARLAAVDPDDTAILVYTSGTTGAPKGAMISHANVLATLRHQADVFTFFEDDLLFSFLPMAHVTERNLVFHLRVGNGVAAAYASSIGAVLAEIGEVRPTIFGAVPRIFEKAYDRIHSETAKKSGLVRKIFAWAVGVGRHTVPYVLAGKPLPAALELQRRLAHRLGFQQDPRCLRRTVEGLHHRGRTDLFGDRRVPVGGGPADLRSLRHDRSHGLDPHQPRRLDADRQRGPGDFPDGMPHRRRRRDRAARAVRIQGLFQERGGDPGR